MLEYKLIRAKEKDSDILNSIKLVTMIDNEMDKALSYSEKEKIKKSVAKNIELNCDEYRLIHVGNKIVGAYLVLPYDDGVIIDEIYLFKEYRNQGIGTSIINRIVKSEDNVYLWVYKNNVNAIRLNNVKSDIYFKTPVSIDLAAAKCSESIASTTDADKVKGYPYISFRFDIDLNGSYWNPKAMKTYSWEN